MIPVIKPQWPAPERVCAISTTRVGGVSQGAWRSLNLGSNCGDVPGDVFENQKRLGECLPAPVQWLSQVHGNTCLKHNGSRIQGDEADAVFSAQVGQVCAVLSADCLPVLFTDINGNQVAAAHAGWRGLAAGVLANTITAMDCEPNNLMAWLGPCIGPDKYEVGFEVRDAFLQVDPTSHIAFRASGTAWLADMNLLAKQQLENAGVTKIFGGNYCTFSESDKFFSFRRDGLTGRMATLIWLN
ncbi:MAG: YfiH family protein [Lysobacterales bacterium]|jgi:YfiH family protein